MERYIQALKVAIRLAQVHQKHYSRAKYDFVLPLDQRKDLHAIAHGGYRVFVNVNSDGEAIYESF